MFTAFAVGLGLTANVMAQVPSYVPSNGLVGWWPFNGNANDESGNGNNGMVNGATLTTDRFGNAGKAYSFDGVDDEILIQSLQSYNFNSKISVSIWIKSLNQTQQKKNLVTKYGGFSDAFSIDVKPNELQFNISSGSANWNTSFNSNLNIDNSWHFVVATYDFTSNIFKIYLDGINISSSTPPFQMGNGNNAPVIFGYFFDPNNTYAGQRYYGDLDDIGIWNRALTDQEISDLYNANICYEYVTVTDTLVINTGITGYNPITYLNTLKIWPNPSNDHITIDAGNLATMNGYSIKIEDAQGQQVFQNAVNQQQFYVDITTWGGNGLYFVRIIDPQGNTVDIKKIVLQ